MRTNKNIIILFLLIGFISAALFVYPWWDKKNQGVVDMSTYEAQIKRNLQTKKELDRAIDDYQKLDERSGLLINEIKKLNKENSGLVEQTGSLRFDFSNEKAALESQIKLLQEEQAQYNKKKGSLESQIKSRIDKSYKSRISRYERQWENLKKENDKLHAVNSGLSKEKESLTQRLAAAENEVNYLSNKMKALTIENDSMTKMVNEKNRQTALLEEQLAGVKTDKVLELSKVKDEADKLSKENSSLLKRIAPIEDWMKEKNRLKEDFQVISRQKQDLESKLSKAEKGRNGLYSQMKELEDLLEEESRQNQLLGRENKELAKQTDKYKTEITNREAARQKELKLVSQEGKRKTQESRKEIEKLKNEADHNLRKIAKLENSLNSVREEVNNERLDLYFDLGVLFDEYGFFEEAKFAYLQALQLSPDDVEIHYNLAVVYDEGLGDYKMAMQHYQRYLELYPNAENLIQVREWIMLAEQKLRLGE